MVLLLGITLMIGYSYMNDLYVKNDSYRKNDLYGKNTDEKNIIIRENTKDGANESDRRYESDDGTGEIDFSTLVQNKDYSKADKNAGADTSENSELIPDDTDREIYEQTLAQGRKAVLAECADDEKLTLLFGGDILLDDNYAMMSSFKSRGSSIEDTFSGDLLDKMQSADIFMLNNEFTFTDRGEPTPGKTFTFRAKPENISFYEKIGVDVVSVANNHIFDYGEISMLDTFDTLEGAGIAYSGAGRNIDEAIKPVYVIGNGMKVAIVCATQIERNSSPDTRAATQDLPGVFRCMEPDMLVNAIKEAKDNSDLVILYIHWGTESQSDIDWLQEKQAPLYAEAGADIIIGCHPHCLQKIDVVEKTPVIYSLGNYWFNSKTLDTGLVELEIIDKELAGIRFIPCIQSDCRTRELHGEERERLLGYMESISPGITIDSEGYINY